MNITELSSKYVELKTQLTDTEGNFKKWKLNIEAQLEGLAEQILTHMRETEQKTLHISAGMFGTTTKSRASISNTEIFTNWLKSSKDNIDFAVVKPRQDAIKRLVEATGEPPEGVNYERMIELTFRRS